MNASTLPRPLVPLTGLAAAALLIWFTGPTLAVAGRTPLAPPALRLALIAALALAWASWALWRALRRRGTEAPAATPAPPPDEARARLLDEAETLRSRFREADAALRRAAGPRRGRPAAPWFVLLGAPGAGKSALLRQAGLAPVQGEAGAAAAQDGPTPDCTCWVGEEGAVFDTAGRYTLPAGDTDRAGWAAFVHLLGRHRRRAPLGGLLVALGAAELLTQDAAAQARQAQAIRERLRALDHAFRLRVPVFLVLTGLDRVAGFVETFATLPREQRLPAWGVAFEPGEGDPAAAFARGFQPLLARLNERLLARLEEERDPQACARLFAFPREMALLQAELARFLEQAFGARPHASAPWLRGVYFTSALQQGTPLQPGQAALGRHCGLQPPPSPRGAAGAQAFFVTGLLQRLWAEAPLVQGDPRLQRRRRWRHALACAAAGAGTATGVALWSGVHAQGQATIARLDTAARSALAAEGLAAEGRAPGGDAALPALLPRLDALRALAEARDGMAGGLAPHDFGLAQPAHLQDAGRRAYLRELNRLLAPQIGAALADELRQALADPDAAYAALKGYLMLAQPQHRDPAALDALLQAAWTRRLPGAPGTVARLRAHAAALLAGGLPPPALDEALLRQARELLARQPLADRVYGRLRREAGSRHELDFSPRAALGLGAAAFERRSGQDLERGIPGFFTARGYAEVFLPQSRQLAQSLQGETWVLGEAAGPHGADELATLQEDVARRYAADYVRAWQALLADLHPAPLRDPAQALQGLARLSARHSPLRALLQAVDSQTALPSPAADPAVDKGAPPVPGDPAAAIRAAFAELASVSRPGADGRAPMDALMEPLARLYAELDAPPLLDAAEAPRRDAGAAVQALKQGALSQPQPLKDWLLQLAGDAQRAGDQAQQAAQQKKRGEDQKALREQVNAAWKAEVLPLCLAAVEGRYPADRAGAQDATPRDFGRLFAPGGLIDGFVKTRLAAFIDAGRKPWRWRASADGLELGAAPESLRPLELAALWRDAYFRDGSGLPSVEFSLRALGPTGSPALVLGEQRIDAATPRAQTLRWPAADGAQQATLVAADGSAAPVRAAEGAWAALRLLDQAAIERTAPDRGVLSYRLPAQSARFELRAASVVNPFLAEAAERFRCPRGF